MITGGSRGRLRIASLRPQDAEGIAELQHQQGIGAHRDRDMCALRIRNASPARSTVFVTVMEAYPAAGSPRLAPCLTESEGGFALAFGAAEGLPSLLLKPDQTNPATPAFSWRE